MKDKDTRLSIGVTLTLIGVLLFLRKFGLLKWISPSITSIMFDWRTYFIYAAIMFLIFKKEKISGLILLIIGMLFHFNVVYRTVMSYSAFIVPGLFLAGGLTLLFLALKK